MNAPIVRSSASAWRRSLVLAVAVLGLLGGVTATAATTPTQPRQSVSGPGGSSTPHHDVRISSGGTGNDAWFVFEPSSPMPKSAPLAIITHGYFEFSGYSSMEALIRHTALTGKVVIYPRWQTNISSPCPGPFDVRACMTSEVNGIKGALAYLKADPHRVQPQLNRTSYFGFSFGGVITTNLANRYKELGLPYPRAVFLDDPHDGGYAGRDEPAVDDYLNGIPSSTLFECHDGADGVIGGPAQNVFGDPRELPENDANGGCNAIFPKLVTIPERNKDALLTHTDKHGSPVLSSAHGVCAGAASEADAYDWNFCWRNWDALQDCAYYQRICQYAVGNTPERRNLGRWSDGVPVTPLVIQKRAPLRP